MNYDLKFHKKALKEWKKLSSTIREQLKKKLSQRLINPRVQAYKIKGYDNIYKIKLKSSGYRLVYEVNNFEIYIFVIVVGKRDTVYDNLDKR